MLKGSRYSNASGHENILWFLVTVVFGGIRKEKFCFLGQCRVEEKDVTTFLALFWFFFCKLYRCLHFCACLRRARVMSHKSAFSSTLYNVIQEVRIEVNKKPWNIFQCSTVLISNCRNWYTCFSMFNGFCFKG